MLFAAGVTVVLGFASWQGCSVYDASLLEPGDGGGPDAQQDAGPQGDGDTCGHVQWPARPDHDDPSDAGDIEFYNALSFLDFGAGDAGAPNAFGFDLDGICTCPGPESCKPVSDAGPKHCDQEGGVDNSGASLVAQFSSASFFDQGYINQQLAAGLFGALMRVRGYNGQANDTKVELSVYTSNGTEGAQYGDASVPKGDGTDRWTVDPDSLLGGTILDGGEPVPKQAYDLNAYVSNYYLVGNLNVPLSIGAANGEGLVTVDLTGSVVVAKLEPYQGSFRTTGVMAGRWSTKKLLTTMQVLNDPLLIGQHLCGSDPTYQALKPKICSFADITSNVQDDGKNAPCDAISMAFSFKATPATFGSVFAKPDSGTPCGPQWTDDCNQ